MVHEAIGHGLEGDFNRKQTSAFSGMVGQQVASPLVTIVDDGTITSRRGSLNVDDEGTPLVDVLSRTSLAGSKRAAREQLSSGAVSVNGVKCPADRRLKTEDLLPGALILLRRGKKSWHATRWS